MKAKPALPERVRSMEGLGRTAAYRLGLGPLWHFGAEIAVEMVQNMYEEIPLFGRPSTRRKARKSLIQLRLASSGRVQILLVRRARRRNAPGLRCCVQTFDLSLSPEPCK